MKKTVTYIVICVLALLVYGNKYIAYAVDSVKVSTAYESIEQLDGQSYIVPIYIVNNPGIMGFRIDINYDPESVKINTISNGKITSAGNFNTNISTSGNDGYVSVWWNSTDNVQGDGSIMYINATVVDAECNVLNLNISYSQEDTFNSEWNDVVLDCYSVSYNVGENGEDDISTTTTVTEGTTEQTQATDDQVGTESTTLESTESFENEDSSVEEAAYKKYEDGTVPKNVISDDGEQTFISNAKKAAGSVAELDDIGEDAFKRAVARRMKEYNIKDVQELDEEKRYEFWNSVNDDLIDIEGVDEKKLADIDIAKLADSIVITDDDIKAADLSVKPKSKKSSSKGIFIWIEAVAIIVIFGAVVVIKRRRR